eukprot:3197847-Alexandrium_andersonii.AAC.1
MAARPERVRAAPPHSPPPPRFRAIGRPRRLRAVFWWPSPSGPVKVDGTGQDRAWPAPEAHRHKTMPALPA